MVQREDSGSCVVVALLSNNDCREKLAEEKKRQLLTFCGKKSFFVCERLKEPRPYEFTFTNCEIQLINHR